MSGRLAHELGTIAVLWRRDLALFARQKSRIVGALAQPILFWLVIGSGLSPTFRLGDGGLDYRSYFYPGVVLMIVLFTGIFATMSVIEDRHQGFLQAVLVAPGSRLAVVLGKSLGGTTVALIQSTLFLLLAPLAGFPWRNIDWFPLFVVLLLAGLALTSLGFAIAWALDSSAGYHVVMNLLLVPAWILSGAMFPVAGLPRPLAIAMAGNPIAWAVSATRRALHGGAPPAGTLPPTGGPAFEIVALAIFAALLVALAARLCQNRASRR